MGSPRRGASSTSAGALRAESGAPLKRFRPLEAVEGWVRRAGADVPTSGDALSFGDTRRLELWMTYVRWFGVLFGALAVAMEPNYPDPTTERAAWLLITFLGLGNLAIWGGLARINSERDLARLGLATFLFDAVVVMGIVWVFAYEHPYVTWALLFVLPLEAALRYRLFGALAAAVAVAAFFIAQSARVAAVTGGEFDYSTYVFVIGLSGLVAGVGGSMAESWHRQRQAFISQTMRLAEIDRLKNKFLAVTSHEIRGPLTAIITGIHTVVRQADRLSIEQRTRVLDMVSMQANQLARLVDDLMLTSELQEHHLALQKEWADLPKTIEQAVEAAASKRRAHQLSLFVEPLRCVIDHTRVAQIVRNLVENAYKYTPDHTSVAVTAKGVSGGIAIEVIDDGDGIPSDRRDQLFEAFHRMHETAAGQDGVGLGLYVVSQLVSAMGGHIDLASSSNGTSFNIHIPCRTMGLEQGGPSVRADTVTATAKDAAS
jgi:signal transduction histidine kinase